MVDLGSDVARGGELGFARAAGRFKRFFDELNATFLEREDVLVQAGLALLSREHLLLTGPPGTAKSQLARAVLGRIIDATTGQPSLFARQFSENTVLTDLVGAIDFKTLMATGRSEHFTDEGIIGSVHAFLDEVFDGRDMLLRSALNLLGERELKQGVRTTQGRVECALMTSNRYLTEVLDESRETLLAFVDRIAFVGFVPKGFSSQEPMRRVMNDGVSGQRPNLRAYLSIQDVDRLQDVVERVRFSEEGCARLVAFLDLFEAEMQAAIRAIPDFTPSRYLSIRSRVRAGRVLKAIVVHQKLFEEPSRPLEVQPSDFVHLRFVLLQSGPPKALLARFAEEQDPREARQLKIIQTERDVFERSLTRLDRSAFVSPVPAPASTLDGLEELSRRVIERGLDATPGSPATRVELDGLLESLEDLSGPVTPLVQWLHARRLALLESAAEQRVLAIEARGDESRGLGATIEGLSSVVRELEGFQVEAEELRARLPGFDASRLQSLLQALACAVVNRLREALHVDARAALLSDASLALEVLAPGLSLLEAFETTLRETHPAFEPLLKALGASALWPTVARALAPLARAPRAEFLSQFDRVWNELSRSGVARRVPFEQLLAAVLEQAIALDSVALNGVALPALGSLSAQSYDAFRRALPRASLAYLAVQLCLRVDGSSVVEFAVQPKLAVFAERLAVLPENLSSTAWQLDTRRIALCLGFFARWREQVELPESAREDRFRLLGVLEQDEALSRLRLETELIEALFPASAGECQRLRAALADLLDALRQRVAGA